MDYSGKKLLILGGAGPHVKVVETAKEMGIYTIVADYLEDSPAKRIADESLLTNIYDIDALVDFGRARKIDGVLGFCLDPTQKPAQQIASRLGLPAFGSGEQVAALTEKSLFKQLCRRAGVDTVRDFDENDPDGVEYPCLVKPGESRGSRGVTVCRNIGELKAAVIRAKEIANDGKCIIEKYMEDGRDLTISYIVRDGEPVLISLGDRYPGREADNLNRQLTCTIQPSRYAADYLEKADGRIRHMIELLGIQNGPVFFQGFYDGDTVRLYDPGIRFPGNEYERIYRRATGLDPVKSIISYCVGGGILDYGGRIRGSYDLCGKTAIQYMVNVGPGVIGSIAGLEEIARHPAVVDVQQRHFPGDVIGNTGDVRHRAGEISILCGRDVSEMEDICRFIQDRLSITDTDGRNMLISPFDISLIGKNYGADRRR